MSDFSPRTSRDASCVFPRLCATSADAPRVMRLPSFLCCCACLNSASLPLRPTVLQHSAVPVQLPVQYQRHKERKNHRKNIFASVSGFCPRASRDASHSFPRLCTTSADAPAHVLPSPVPLLLCLFEHRLPPSVLQHNQCSTSAPVPEARGAKKSSEKHFRECVRFLS